MKTALSPDVPGQLSQRVNREAIDDAKLLLIDQSMLSSLICSGLSCDETCDEMIVSACGRLCDRVAAKIITPRRAPIQCDNGDPCYLPQCQPHGCTRDASRFPAAPVAP